MPAYIRSDLFERRRVLLNDWVRYRAEGPEEKDPKATKVDLERYGIRPTPSEGGVVTNEMVNKIRDELGV